MGTIGRRQFQPGVDNKFTDLQGNTIAKQSTSKLHSSLRVGRGKRQDQGHVKVVRGLIPQSRGPCPTVQKIQVIDQNEYLLKKMESHLTEKRNQFSGPENDSLQGMQKTLDDRLNADLLNITLSKRRLNKSNLMEFENAGSLAHDIHNQSKENHLTRTQVSDEESCPQNDSKEAYAMLTLYNINDQTLSMPEGLDKGQVILNDTNINHN